MRRFVVVGHDVPADGAWGLDDLCGAAGRVDALCRSVAAALLLSHGIRRDTEVRVVLVGDVHRPVAVRLRGAALRRLNPDERSTAARLRQALRARLGDPWWQEVQPGLDVSPFTLAEVLDDAGGVPVLLHRDGDALEGAEIPADAVFVLSDHRSLAPGEEDEVAGRRGLRVSLGPFWYHADHAVHAVQRHLDLVSVQPADRSKTL